MFQQQLCCKDDTKTSRNKEDIRLLSINQFHFMQKLLFERICTNITLLTTMLTGSWFLESDIAVEFYKYIFWWFEQQQVRKRKRTYLREGLHFNGWYLYYFNTTKTVILINSTTTPLLFNVVGGFKKYNVWLFLSHLNISLSSMVASQKL